MKKGLIFVLFALVSVVSYSQISWNVKAGMNMSNLSGVEESSMKIGYNIGVGMEYQFTDMWSIQPSLLFTTKGAKQDLSYKDYKDEYTYNPMYLELPIMAAARFAVSDNMNVVVSAGPYFAYGLGGKVKNEFTDWDEDTDKEYIASIKHDIFKDVKDEDGQVEEKGAKRFDFGLGVGVAFEFNKFFVGLNGEFGLAKFADAPEFDKDGDIIGKKSAKNMNFSIGVGYKF